MIKAGVVKNPLSVIAIFAGTAEISGAAVLPFIDPANQKLYIYFLILFPTILVFLFFATLNWNHKTLYAPSDYHSDDSFLEGIRKPKSSRPELSTFEDDIEKVIDKALSSQATDNQIETTEKERIANEIKDSIKKNSFIKVDASQLTGNNNVFELPFVAFPSLNDLTDEVYFSINDHVKPFEYGHTWVLRHANKQVIKNSRMITGTKKGIPCPDLRSLKEVGIEPGMTLFVTRP